MTFTEEHLRQLSGWLAETEAKSIGSFPADFDVTSGADDLTRIFRFDTSDAVDFGVAFLKKYHTAAAIPASFDPADLPDDPWLVIEPTMDGEVHEGNFLSTKVRVFRQIQNGREYFYIAQTLERVYDSIIDDEGNFLHARRVSRERYRSSESGSFIQFYNIDPREVARLVDENLISETYTNIVLPEETLSGTWHNLLTRQGVSAAGASEVGTPSNIIWEISRQANDDVHFMYQKNDGTKVVDFFKFDASDTGLASFETEYYFDDLGNWYICTDGTNYTQKNGVDGTGLLSGEPGYGTTLGTIRTNISGRMADPVQITRSEKTRFYRLYAHIEFYDVEGYSITTQRDVNTTVTEIVAYSTAADMGDFITDNGLDIAVSGKTVELDAVLDENRGLYRLSAIVVTTTSNDANVSFVSNLATRVMDFYLFGITAAKSESFKTDYLFSDDGTYDVAGGTGTDLNTAVGGRTASIQLDKAQDGGYNLHAHIEFADDKDYSLVFYSDPSVVMSDITYYSESDDVSAFAAQCWVHPVTGVVSIGVNPADGSSSLDQSVAKRTATVQSQFDDQRGEYAIRAVVVHIILSDMIFAYKPTNKTQVIDFRIFGASEAELKASLTNYFFTADGDYYYSTDHSTILKENGVDYIGVGTIASVGALSINQDYNETGISRIVTTPQISRNPTAEVYALEMQITYTSAVSVTGTATYGTPLVKVSDALVIGATSLPTNTGIDYHSKGTNTTEIQVIDPSYDPISETWSYLERTTIRWAPHANQSDGVAGYVEGPSEIRRELQEATLARGVGSGFSATGAWAGGGVARIRYVEGGDGYGTTALTSITVPMVQTVQVTKKFVPYNVTIARYCLVKTHVRLYYYMKEPVFSQYPAAFGDWAKTEIENKDVADMEISEDIENISGISLRVDTVNLGGTASSGLFGETDSKIAVHTYTDGSFTIVCNEKTIGENGNGDPTDITTYPLKFIRNYPAEGTATTPVELLAFTSVSDDGNGKLKLTVSHPHFYLMENETIRIYGSTGAAYDALHTITEVNDSTSSVTLDTPYNGSTAVTGKIARGYGLYGTVLVDEAGLKAGNFDALLDDGISMGHKILTSTGYYIDGIRHRIIPGNDGVHALAIEISERTPWQWDHLNKWILNTEGFDVDTGLPASMPSPASAADGSTEIVL